MTDREVEHLKELVFTHLDEWRRALDLQAHEYERRLDELNHAHAAARRVLGTYLPRETWEAWQQEFRRQEERRGEETQRLRETLADAFTRQDWEAHLRDNNGRQERDTARMTALERSVGGLRGEARALALLAAVLGGMVGAGIAAVISHVLGGG